MGWHDQTRLAGSEGIRSVLRLRPRFGLLVRRSSSGAEELLPLVAELAVLGPVQVLDAGNHFDAIRVAYAIRHLTPDLPAVSDHLRIVRAFTCIEAVKGLQQMAAGAPVIVLDLLATFYDDAVSDRRSVLLVDECVAQIRRLGTHAPVVASVRINGPEKGPRAQLLPRLRAAADLVDDEVAAAPPPQARMF